MKTFPQVSPSPSHTKKKLKELLVNWKFCKVRHNIFLREMGKWSTYLQSKFHPPPISPWLWIFSELITCKWTTFIFFSRDGPDIRFSIRYPAGSNHFSAIWCPAGYLISKTVYRISGYTAGYPANRILSDTFFSYLKNWDASILCVTLSNAEATL